MTDLWLCLWEFGKHVRTDALVRFLPNARLRRRRAFRLRDRVGRRRPSPRSSPVVARVVRLGRGRRRTRRRREYAGAGGSGRPPAEAPARTRRCRRGRCHRRRHHRRGLWHRGRRAAGGGASAPQQSGRGRSRTRPEPPRAPAALPSVGERRCGCQNGASTGAGVGPPPRRPRPGRVRRHPAGRTGSAGLLPGRHRGDADARRALGRRTRGSWFQRQEKVSSRRKNELRV